MYADSTADGALEAIGFIRPKTSVPATEDFRPGHEWFFYAGAIFKLPNKRGSVRAFEKSFSREFFMEEANRL